jgi:hypothetical protein
MKKFGDTEKFGIWVDNYYSLFKDDPEYVENPEKYEIGGDVYFWVKGKNLFAFDDGAPCHTYGHDLSPIVQMFCQNLFYHITDDPFPVQTKSKLGVEMMDETNLVQGDDSDLRKWADIDWDNVDMSLRDKIDEWNLHHGYIAYSAGSYLPCLYVRKVQNMLEISWNNKYSCKGRDGEYYFIHKKGVEFIDIRLYRDTAVAFCLDFINKFKDKYPKKMEENRANLQKAIDVII